MKKSKAQSQPNQTTINRVEVTSDTLTSRGGLTLFVKYFHNIQLVPHLEKVFGFLRKSRKGQAIGEVFKQLFCFLLNGSSRHLSYFDHLKKDAGYAAGIESTPEQLLSSDGVKRFFRKLLFCRSWLFRKVMLSLLLWRLRVEQPKVLIFGLDTMVMDNDEALKREGVKPTYKKVKGYQPLQMTWGKYLVDAIFRSGDKHSNYSNHVQKMIGRMVEFIRKNYSEDIPIIFCMDSGFFDQKIFQFCEKLEVGYISGGKLYNDTKETVKSLDPNFWDELDKGKQVWRYVEFEDRRGNWKQDRRAVFCQPVYEGDQQTMEFARPDTIMYTNLGRGEAIDEALQKAGYGKLLQTGEIVRLYHERGADELVHRALKDFADQRLPFKHFSQNMAYYYTMVLAFFVYESFKEDVCAPVIPVTSYATSLRRHLIDIAAKVVASGKTIRLKVTQTTWNALNIKELWDRCFMASPLPMLA